MGTRHSIIAVCGSLLALAIVAPAASASGKAAGGGATSTTLSTTTTSSTSGGGGGGGGSARGGLNDVVVPTPATVPCAQVTSASATVGYYSVWAALWNNFSVRNCANGQETVVLTITNTDRSTGRVAYSAIVSWSLASGQNMSGVYDNDFATFSTDFDVTYVLTDGAGTQLDRWTTIATTPAPR